MLDCHLLFVLPALKIVNKILTQLLNVFIHSVFIGISFTLFVILNFVCMKVILFSMILIFDTSPSCFSFRFALRFRLTFLDRFRSTSQIAHWNLAIFLVKKKNYTWWLYGIPLVTLKKSLLVVFEGPTHRDSLWWLQYIFIPILHPTLFYVICWAIIHSFIH